MPSLKFLARRLCDRAFGTEFDRAITRARGDSRRAFLFYWNRGLGDIALGLVPLFLRVRNEFAQSRIEVITREELRPAFELAGVDAVHVVDGLARESRIDLAAAAPELGIELASFAATFGYPDPNRWLEGRRHEFPPVLAWNAGWDGLVDRFPEIAANRIVIGAHVNSETAGYYGYVKDWPAESWRALIASHEDDPRVQWLLFGNSAEPAMDGANVIDLRGRTTFAELMAIVRTRCRILVAPDSGVLTMAYYLDATFPLEVLSLWSDPRQGILLQDCPSPNGKLNHVALRGPGEDVRRLRVEDVERALCEAIART
jgi:ADP-heptose:LPS heptosyltransferase